MQHALVVGGGQARRRAGARSPPPCPAGSRPMRRSSEPRSSPSTYSMDRKRWPSTSPTSWTRQTAGWVTWRAMRTSLKKRSRRSASSCSGLGQELQRDRLPELQVVGAVDLAHAAAPDEADDAVALDEERAGVEARAVADRRCGAAAELATSRGDGPGGVVRRTSRPSGRAGRPARAARCPSGWPSQVHRAPQPAQKRADAGTGSEQLGQGSVTGEYYGDQPPGDPLSGRRRPWCLRALPTPATPRSESGKRLPARRCASRARIVGLARAELAGCGRARRCRT